MCVCVCVCVCVCSSSSSSYVHALLNRHFTSKYLFLGLKNRNITQEERNYIAINIKKRRFSMTTFFIRTMKNTLHKYLNKQCINFILV